MDHSLPPMVTQSGKRYQADFTPLLNIIKKRKWLTLLPSLILLPLVVVKLLLQEPAYQSTASIQIEPDNPNIVGFQEILKIGSYHDYYQTQYRLISSRPVLEKTIDALAAADRQTLAAPAAETVDEIETLWSYISVYLSQNRVFLALYDKLQHFFSHFATTDTASSPTRDQIEREKRIDAFSQALTVKPIADTRLVDITITAPDAAESARKVNTLAEIYVEHNLVHKRQSTEESSTWLTNLVETLKTSLQSSEQHLHDFVTKHGMANVELEKIQSVALDGLRNLNTEYIETKVHRMDLQARLEELTDLQRHSLPSSQSLATTLSDPIIANLLMQHAELSKEQAKIAQKFKPGHPQYTDIVTQIETVKKSLATIIKQKINSIKTELHSMQSKELALYQELNENQFTNISTNADIVRYSILKGEVKNKRELYQDIVRRLSEANITKGLETNNIRIVQRGQVPIHPEPAWKGTICLASMILTVTIGMALAFLAELLDKRFRDTDEAERDLQLPFLGLIPRSKSHHRRLGKTLDFRQYNYDDFVPYRLLRTNLHFIMTQRSISSLLITSAAPGEGKSTTAANLGASFAILGKRVLLVDADLYRPTLHSIFQLPLSPGLSDILMSSPHYHTLIQQTNVQNLSILTRGSIPTRPTELLSNLKMKELIHQLEKDYDVVIYDTPMVLSLPDTTVLACEIEGILLVHNIDVVDKLSVITAKQTLERVNASILGIVFNNIDMRKRTHHSYRYRYDGDNAQPQRFITESL